MRLNTVQGRLTATMMLIVVLLSAFALQMFTHSRATAQMYQERLSDLVRVAELTQAVDEAAGTLGQLATGPSADQTEARFRELRTTIYRLRRELPTTTVSPGGARLMADLDNMTDSFLVEAGAAIYAFRAANLDRYYEHDREAATIARYVRETADRLLSAELEAFRQVYPEVLTRDRLLQNLALGVLAAVIALVVAAAWSFARSVTDPLQALAGAARRIAGGDLTGPAVPVGTDEEIRVVGQAFNQMQESLRRHMAELASKAELERRLRHEEMENLQTQSLLREAELRALQSQVNPHFLFNTLNMVAKTALIEGADRTCGLLETVADLLRYSLRAPDRPVTLAEEVAQVRRYMTIQQERFRERIRFTCEVDESALALTIPCLMVQPLVENAVLHGIGSREHGGTVALAVKRAGDRVQVSVADDGVGIPEDRLQALMEGTAEIHALGHSTGLGIYNVRRRLDLFYRGEAGFQIESAPGRGTRCLIELPYRQEWLPAGASEERHGGENHAHPGG
ncbi:signal transduction histidine kinase [Symbiobacterium terraclitae]|uniref:histidine kinase n=1 Tax=Symbiobacterium terraclitae TaxID=557451 RepID=A0ABS4JXM7_9FIRM|nr:signal transduction histidine kinase [Symbiobacterium terraclitae]